MTNGEIMAIALKQSAIDCNCSPEDFQSGESIVTISREDPRARKYLPLPFACDLVSYGSCIVAQTSRELHGVVGEYIRRYPAEHALETPHLHVLDDALREYGLKVCFMAEYFLPDVNRLRRQTCPYPLRILHPEDFAHLYQPEWSNALCQKRKALDVLAVGAYDGERLVGLAGCSADCQTMYQIGVDVLPEYRRRGIASALTSALALEILALGKVPFYCAAWCNMASVRNAVRCGFYPAWAEVTAREMDFVHAMNGRKIEMTELRYGDILVRTARRSDAKQLAAWWNDGEVMAHAGFPKGLGTTEEKVTAGLGEGLLIIEAGGIPIGECNYRMVDEKTAEIGIKICRKDHQERGIGRIVLSLLIRYLFDRGAEQISLDTNLNNLRAQHVYQSLGFRKLRVNVDAWKDQLGQWQSSVDYGLTEGDFAKEKTNGLKL